MHSVETYLNNYTDINKISLFFWLSSSVYFYIFFVIISQYIISTNYLVAQHDLPSPRNSSMKWIYLFLLGYTFFHSSIYFSIFQNKKGNLLLTHMGKESGHVRTQEHCHRSWWIYRPRKQNGCPEAIGRFVAFSHPW